jgi:hypothetical protein
MPENVSSIVHVLVIIGHHLPSLGIIHHGISSSHTPQSAPQALTGDETPQGLARRTRDALRALRDGR